MFKNEPLLDFTIPSVIESVQAALNTLNSKIGSSPLVASPIIGGKRITGLKTLPSTDPALPSVAIGHSELAIETHARQALEVLSHGAPAWAATPFAERAKIIRDVGERMCKERLALTALIIREAGKNWREADKDVCEAIDFCRFYADEMLRLGPPRRTMQVPGEENTYYYRPKGIAVVIAPWNFPLAIACGMTVAALVAGNCTALKPAEQTPLIAAEFARIVLEAGVPASAFAFLPGLGEVVGRALVQDPLTDLICFTGSKAVGLEILKSASQVLPGQRSIKRVITELGGKNALIVDEDADLDEAIKASIESAFGFSGQKCSALSRLIVIGDAYELLLERLKDATSDLIIGVPQAPATFLGPVIDEQAQQRILSTIQEAEKRLTLVYKGKVPSQGYFVPPTLFRDVPAQDPLWREEVFGPVVACVKARSIEEAVMMANDSEYALTGGICSRSPKNIDYVRSHLRVGNLYINRGITGALVCRQPFGGFQMSGIGSKAGGSDYLLQFLEPRTCTENTMRRGFAPE
jgi:RHH-type proline utilization regulon transcriptional repressor/proline dehydrogenase/delta 1-pyrroline-5-carboxylate dehydrogenase